VLSELAQRFSSKALREQMNNPACDAQKLFDLISDTPDHA